jgi:hypothetical protein
MILLRHRRAGSIEDTHFLASFFIMAAAQEVQAAPPPCPLAPLLHDERSRHFLCQAMGALPAPDQAENLLLAWWLLVHERGLAVSPVAVEKLVALINAAKQKFWSTLGQFYIETVAEGDDRGDAGINHTAGGMLAALQAAPQTAAA